MEEGVGREEVTMGERVGGGLVHEVDCGCAGLQGR